MVLALPVALSPLLPPWSIFTSSFSVVPISFPVCARRNATPSQAWACKERTLQTCSKNGPFGTASRRIPIVRIRGGNLYIEGKLQSRMWTDNEGTPKAITEIVLDDMVMLDSKLPETKPEKTNHHTDEQVATS